MSDTVWWVLEFNYIAAMTHSVLISTKAFPTSPAAYRCIDLNKQTESEIGIFDKILAPVVLNFEDGKKVFWKITLPSRKYLSQ